MLERREGETGWRGVERRGDRSGEVKGARGANRCFMLFAAVAGGGGQVECSGWRGGEGGSS